MLEPYLISGHNLPIQETYMRWKLEFMPLIALVAIGCGSDSKSDPVTPPAPQFGQVTGTVRDNTGANVAGATVTLASAGQTSLTQTSGATGAYTFSSVRTGTWTASVTAPTGFSATATPTRTVTVTANSTATVEPFVVTRENVVAPPNQVAVDMRNSAFNPASVTVAVNGTVTWTNSDPIAHNANGDGGINTGNFTQGQSRSHTFPAAGSFSYRCTLHSGMNGTVIVR